MSQLLVGATGVAASERARQALYLYCRASRLDALFADKPYVLAIVELEEGPRMTTNMEASPEELTIGMPVTAYFDDVTPQQTLVKFKPA